MVISYLGAEAFKIQFGEITIAYNPVSKESKLDSSLKSASFGSDIVLVSTNHPDMNGVENASRGDRAPFVITGPGEYEIKGVFIHGYPSISKYGTKGETDRINTIYTVTLENMNLCFLGALGSTDLSAEVVEELGQIDILFTPIGGDGVLTPAEANKMAVSLEPKIIVPMHYGLGGDKKALESFLKEAGEDDPQKHDKLTVKLKDLEGKEGDVVVINQS